MSSPPPPYSLHPPPYKQPQKPPAPPRISSRRILTEALARAQHAVKLDLADADLRDTIEEYDASIALLDSVLARRERRRENADEAARVREIRDKYVERVRALCAARGLALPAHVPPPTPSSPPLPPTPPPRAPSPALSDDAPRQPSEPPTPSPSAFTFPPVRAPAEPDGWAARHAGYQEPEQDPDDAEWILSEAREEELREWGRYLEGRTVPSEDRDPSSAPRRGSVASVSSAVWSMATDVSHEDTRAYNQCIRV
ncbi:hypothetical protein BC834DRAFT_414008 [Gloeopeniophorella convolvens]|nr:hypothetical protein BC834DRAFT_414008 [Gloeopeniophorella convolvens]